MHIKTVVLVGKPNVGKSTIFNRFIGKRKSIVHDKPGITRDRIYEKVIWNGKTFNLIDTGGIEIENKPLQDLIKIQANIAIQEADVIIFVVDGRMDLTSDDFLVLDILRKSNKKILLVANKLDANIDFDTSIYTLGFEEIFKISAIHGEGTGKLLDEIVLQCPDDDTVSKNAFKLAIIGRPNAGKSSLLNRLLNEERSIVSPLSGTTRDSVHSKIKINNADFEIIDTAGINRKSKLVESVDHYALNRAFKSLDEAQLTLFLIDSTRDLSHFDARVAGYAMEKNKPLIIVINKWDLIDRSTNTMDKFTKKLRKEFKFLSWSPVIYISALKGSRITSLIDTIMDVKNNISKKLDKSLLNEVVMQAQMLQPAPSYRKGRVQIMYIKQIRAEIPTFIAYINNRYYLHFSYERYIENQIRENFDFTGTPIRIKFRDKYKTTQKISYG